ncbi:protein DJ-1 homolog C isoform X3 [Oryza sativa Japonica Group]|uniref:protein DJ-1 homolog C isoform X3 n=1 Tax=Oryza sativa subsp. japonica TaxID=39947 RepID=UPI0007755329
MLPSSRYLLAPAPLPAMVVRPPPPHPPSRGTSPLARPPLCRAMARAAPSLSAAASTAASSSTTPAKKKVLLPIAMGTEEMEAVILAGVLRRAGADVTLASVEDGLEVEASRGSHIVADKRIAACADQVFDLVALPVSGELTTSRGPGTAFQFALSFVEQLFGPCKAEDMDNTLLTKVDDNLERSIEVNEIEWSSDHNPHVLIPIANGSEEMEIIMLTDVLRRANVNVVLASVEKSTSIVGSQRMRIVADKCISDASALEYDLIILPGGPAGAERLHKSSVLKKLLKEQKQTGRMYGGICSSPVILQKQGLLQDKTVTAHPSIVNQLTCEVIDRSKVVIDGNLITGMGLGTVIDFSLAIIKKFFGHGRAKGVANGMVFEYPKS